MKKSPLAAALLVLGAASARASKAYDCRHFAKGEGIITNIVGRHFGDSSEPDFLLGHVLKVTRDDADAAKNIAKASLKSGSGCSAVSSAAAALGRTMDAEMAALDKAAPICRKVPAKLEDAFLCADAAKAAFALERDGAAAIKAFFDAGKASPSCTTLAFGDQAKLESDTPEAVFVRLQKKPCRRDDRCEKIRIGKLREARGELAKIDAGGKDAPPPELSAAHEAAKPLLFHQDGEATDAQPKDTDGAENILWHMMVYPNYWGGKADDDTHWIFVAAGKLYQASQILQKGYDAASCDAAVAADPQTAGN